MHEEWPYIVRCHVVTVVTDIVYARSSAEAIRRVRNGRGDRIGTYVDERCPPTHFQADLEESEDFAATGAKRSVPSQPDACHGAASWPGIPVPGRSGRR